MATRRNAPLRVVNVVGARPNFVKIASVMKAYGANDSIEPILVHTGQHYEQALSDVFFRDLAIPAPDLNLGVGSASHAVQTAEIIKAFETVVIERRPDAVLVVGDVNSTIACGLVAVKLGTPVVHVEAGLRSRDRSMPEEINRVLTDAVSDLLFCTEQAGVDNLAREGIDADKVFLVGNVMVDTLLAHRERAEDSAVLERLGLGAGNYAVMTLHRPSNVDDALALARILDAADAVQDVLPLVIPMHPRLVAGLAAAGLDGRLRAMPGVRPTSPLGYLDFLKLMADAKVVLTDSGGIQEETTILGVPCLTLRDNTERPVTVDMGTNQLVGNNPARILATFHDVLANPRRGGIPPLWDGKSAGRIVDKLVETL